MVFREHLIIHTSHFCFMAWTRTATSFLSNNYVRNITGLAMKSHLKKIMVMSEDLKHTYILYKKQA